MEKQFLEAGEIVSTHGIQGEVKILPWADSPEFLLSFRTLYLNGQPYTVQSSRVHKTCVLAKLQGIDNPEDATLLRGKVVSIDRSQVKLPKGTYFCCDLEGLEVFDLRLDRVIGKLTEVLERPASSIYVVKNGDAEYMIPVAGDFIQGVDLEAGRLTVKTIPGMVGDE